MQLHQQLDALNKNLELHVVELTFMEQLRAAVKEKEAELATANVTIEELVKEKDLMKEAHTEVTARIANGDDTDGDIEVDVLRIDVEALNEVVRDRENDLLVATAEIEQLKATNIKMKEDIEEMKIDLDAKTKKLNAPLSPTVQAAQNDNANMMNTIKQTKLLMQKDEEISEAQEQLSQKDKEISSLNKQMDGTKVNIGDAKKEQTKVENFTVSKREGTE